MIHTSHPLSHARRYAALVLLPSGHRLIKLLESNLAQGAILIARAVPGKPLFSLFPDQDSLEIFQYCHGRQH